MILADAAEISPDKFGHFKNFMSWSMYSLQTRNFFLMALAKNEK